ncbi:flagellar basal body-associated FliL family protein [Salinarimonas rosea]|uniref:flagellar basal body-associated FliL family protein n=1 Tax=Salinarimonas rosea TaxID=552063 RepID=UPI00041DDD7A|nr:flagellar basal body-associated FliL family protein [Salinarimonas rosea]
MAREPARAALPALSAGLPAPTGTASAPALPSRGRGRGASGEEKGSGVAFAVALVLLTLLGVGTGAGLGLTLGDPADPGATVAAGDAAPAVRDADVSLVRLDPVVANLADPAEVWVRVDAALLLDGVEPEEAQALAARVSGDTLAYLRTLPLARLEGATGLAHLREDLTERARTRSEGRVREFVIESLVVQ